jgi:hypothetical protein
MAKPDQRMQFRGGGSLRFVASDDADVLRGTAAPFSGDLHDLAMADVVFWPVAIAALWFAVGEAADAATTR